MKKVKAGWLDKSKRGFSSLDNLMMFNRYVGFKALKEKYMMTSVRGTYYAVRPSAFFRTDQDKARGKYFIFDTKEELLTWMMN